VHIAAEFLILQMNMAKKKTKTNIKNLLNTFEIETQFSKGKLSNKERLALHTDNENLFPWEKKKNEKKH
jgi:hypothetical protein